MTKKAEFNADEWSTITEGPLIAGARVIKADGGGTVRESIALGKYYAHAKEQEGQTELLDDLLATSPSIDSKQIAGADIETLTDQSLRAALEILEAKATPEEVAAYKAFVLALAQTAAERHTEGGFLTIGMLGGKKVSDKEQAAIDAIKASLGA